ncbi:tRNA uridine-5-carboxymethylaminomethyl(34) synthesis GTPase MnmE, partial [Bacteroidota bacterium]|nr:tRNA uridine-5-carboxymethylaminomethyl(34) synthesis GTPase MnmE [Bacteroidota bacterium]
TDSNVVLTNTRHLNELNECLKEVNMVIENINKLSSDLISVNIRKALGHLGNITGEITTDNLLGNIFSNFCIGK